MIKARGDYLLFHWRGQWRVASMQSDESLFWDSFRGWELPTDALANLSFSFVLAATSGLLYCYGAVDGTTLAVVDVPDTLGGWRLAPVVMRQCAVSRQHVMELANRLLPLGDESIGFVVRSPDYAYGVRVCSEGQGAVASIRERVHGAERGLNELAMLCVLRCCGGNAAARVSLNAHFQSGPYEESWHAVARAYDNWCADVVNAYDQLLRSSPSAAAFAEGTKSQRYAKVLHAMRFALKDCAVDAGGAERVHAYAVRASAAQVRALQGWVLGVMDQ